MAEVAECVAEEARREGQRQGLRAGGILAESVRWYCDFAAAAVGADAVGVVVADSPHDPSRVSSAVSQRLSLASGVAEESRSPWTASWKRWRES